MCSFLKQDSATVPSRDIFLGNLGQSITYTYTVYKIEIIQTLLVFAPKTERNNPETKYERWKE